MLKGIHIKKNNKFENLLDFIYPIGTLYFSFDNNSPANKFGGTWVQLVETFLYCANSSNVSGGANQQKLTVEQMPLHSHDNVYGTGEGSKIYLSSRWLQTAPSLSSNWCNVIGASPGWGYYQPKNTNQDYDRLVTQSRGGGHLSTICRFIQLATVEDAPHKSKGGEIVC